ncbi:accessory Sec system S-layer assembly protein [Rossellomorea vietnamensis]|uniref:Accessory Sec system S-layer assembly protein n=1 Tax=Rossellomorea vietnamensis TaxID=218284 RepID=A0A5D4M0P2_9BACI|nr:accessory Sec system S-layer assembly protein [Rossellomorea vietnamensis]TYR94878.1 accessory Sec system S-layer assembly protein [Rossellomorea vietnamensis]
MFKFLDRFKKGEIKATGESSTVSSEELFSGEPEGKESARLITTELSFHPQSKISTEEKYFFQFLHNELPQLKENQIAIHGVDLKRDEKALYVTTFLRNSLSKEVQFKTLPLLLTGPSGEIIARKEFDLSALGKLPPLSSRPWQFQFPLDSLNTNEIPETGWNLAFELKTVSGPHKLDLEQSWKDTMSDEDVKQLESFVNTLKAPKRGEVNFFGMQIKRDDRGRLLTTLLIRNGTEKDISIEQLPLTIEDGAGNIIAQGGFKLNQLKVKANSSKPWTFVFPESTILLRDADLSEWKVNTSGK